MGKHSMENQSKINFKKISISAFVIIILVIGINLALSNRKINQDPLINKDFQNNSDEQKNTETLVKTKTIEGEKLVIKSTSDYNKIIEYSFEEGILKTVKIYEQFENIETFNEKKANYEKANNIKINNTNEQELTIEIEKEEFGSDEGKSYEQIYDKYLVEIIGSYEVIK